MNAATTPPAPDTRRQRAKALAAVTELSGRQPPQTIQIRALAQAAQITPATLAHLFTDVDHCLAAALEDALDTINATIEPPYRTADTWAGGVSDALRAGLELLDQQPALARLTILTAPAAGPVTQERRRGALNGLTHALAQGPPLAREPISMLSAEAIIGALHAILQKRLAEQHPTPLSTLRESLLTIAVLPHAPSRRSAAQPDRRPRPRNATPGGPLLRASYRTARVLAAIAERPASPSQLIARAAGIRDPGQISKLARRLQRDGLIKNTAQLEYPNAPKAWVLTRAGTRYYSQLRERYPSLEDQSPTEQQATRPHTTLTADPNVNIGPDTPTRQHAPA